MPRTLGHEIWIGNEPGTGRPLTLRPQERASGLYIVGMPNMGKSRTMEHLIRQDIEKSRRSGSGLLFIDPLGSSYKNIMAWLSRRDRGGLKVVPIDLTSKDWVCAYNMLRPRAGDGDPSVIAEAMMQAMLYARQNASSDVMTQLERWTRNALMLLHCAGQSIQRAPELFQNPAARRGLLPSVPEGPSRADWEWALDEKNRREFTELIQSSLGLLQRFVNNQQIQLMTGMLGASLDLGQAIAEGWIILVNASQEGGMVNETVASTFTTMLLTDLWQAAQSRGKPKDGKNALPFYVYIDEFQNCLNPAIATQLAQARGMGLHLTLAHQFPSQLTSKGPVGEQIHHAVLGTVANQIVFRTQHPADVEMLAQRMYGSTFDPEKIRNVIKHRGVVDHRWIQVTDTSESEGDSETEQAGTNAGRGTGTSNLFSVDEDGRQGMFPNASTDSENAQDGESASNARTRSSQRGQTTRNVMEPIYGEQIASIERVPVADQMVAGVQILTGQLQQHCVVKLMNMSAPAAIKAPHVPEVRAGDELISTYVEVCCEKLPFMHRRTEALRMLEENRKAFSHSIQELIVGDEPVPRARKIHSQIRAPVLGPPRVKPPVLKSPE